jgi:prephenate dehydratase/chorismate mutase/prephenate dehydratase
MKAGYQGEPGAFSEQAVRTLLPDGEPVPHRTFVSVFEAVVSGDLRYGVVPIENSQAGSINDTYDLLAHHHLWIAGEVAVRVDQALLALPGTRLEDVRRVVSHPQALAQSAEFLASLDAEVVPDYDTAGAARRIAEQHLTGEAAVASERAAELYGLEVLARRIQTHHENHTRFVAVAVDRTPSARQTSPLWCSAWVTGPARCTVRSGRSRSANSTCRSSSRVRSATARGDTASTSTWRPRTPTRS